MTRTPFFGVALLALLFAAPPPARAQDATDIHLWAQILATITVSEHWRVHLEAQPRWDEEVSRSSQLITRTAVGRRLTDRVTVWGGHAWVAKPPGPGTAHEQRLWQQASITLPVVKAWAPSLRLRQEQRWQQGWGDSSHRLRVMGRAVRPFSDVSRWSLATYNETMVTFDETAGGPPHTFDQNRLFGGLLYRMTRRESLEFGGIWVAATGAGSRMTHAYVPFVWLNLTY